MPELSALSPRRIVRQVHQHYRRHRMLSCLLSDVEVSLTYQQGWQGVPRTGTTGDHKYIWELGHRDGKRPLPPRFLPLMGAVLSELVGSAFQGLQGLASLLMYAALGLTTLLVGAVTVMFVPALLLTVLVILVVIILKALHVHT